jgi:hypothetical protein
MKHLTVLISILILSSGCSDKVDEQMLHGHWYLNKIKVNDKVSRGGSVMLCPTLDINADYQFSSIEHMSSSNGKWSVSGDRLKFSYFNVNSTIVDECIVSELRPNNLKLTFNDSIVYFYNRNCNERQEK